MVNLNKHWNIKTIKIILLSLPGSWAHFLFLSLAWKFYCKLIQIVTPSLDSALFHFWLLNKEKSGFVLLIAFINWSCNIFASLLYLVLIIHFTKIETAVSRDGEEDINIFSQFYLILWTGPTTSEGLPW